MVRFGSSVPSARNLPTFVWRGIWFEEAHLRALQRAEEGDVGALGELLARSILDSLYKFVVPAVAGPARLLPLAALTDDRINADALRVAAHRGRLQATRGADGQWRSSRNWVDEYLDGRWRRGLA